MRAASRGAFSDFECRPSGTSRTKRHPIKAGTIPKRGVCGCWCVWEHASAASQWGSRGVGIAEQVCSLILSGEGREIKREQKGARLPPASGARARGEMDAGGLACAAIGTCLRTYFVIPKEPRTSG